MLFFQNIFGFFCSFFFFFPLFHFHWKEKFQSPQRERRSQVFWRREERGMRRGEQMRGKRRRKRGGQGREGVRVSFSLLSLVSSLSLGVRCVSLALWWVLCVKLLLLVWFLVGDGGLFGLLQRVAALILLLHPVHQQHHQEGCEQGAHYSSHYHRCRETERQGGYLKQQNIIRQNTQKYTETTETETNY